MKPYLGILIDSFWEAVGNKVLWALLLGWSVILGALAPFGYVTEKSFQMSSADISNRSILLEKIAEGVEGKANPSITAVTDKLGDEFKEKIRKASKSDDKNDLTREFRSSEVAKELNAAITSTDLYSAEAFPTAEKRKRLQPIIEKAQDSRSTAETEELNRVLLRLAFPTSVYSADGEQLWIGYAGFKIGEPLSISRRQIDQFLEPIFLNVIINFGLAVVAVFVAIIVTSPMIPDTFRSGSLHLLLSKPISRVWLYLSKFFGGTVFVLFNITFVLLGLYFIAGLRFEIWNSGLLACIPLLMFVFVIFYCVSGLAGLLWGNAIVCVVAAMIFWLFCFAASSLHDVMLPQVDLYQRISRLTPIDDQLTAISERGEFSVWNEEYQVWQPGLKRRVGPGARTFGPLYDKQNDRIVIKSFFRDPFGGLRSRSRNIDYVSLGASEGEQEAPTNIEEARDNARWLSDQGPEVPPQIFDMIQVGDDMLAICLGGIFRLDPDQIEKDDSKSTGLFGIEIPWPIQEEKAEAFQNIAPADLVIADNTYAAATANQNGLVLFGSGNVEHLELVAGKLELKASYKLDGGDGTEAAIAQMNDEFCVVARDNLPLVILDAEFESATEVPLPGKLKVKQLAWRPDSNELSVATHTGELLTLDCSSKELSKQSLPISGNFTAIRWTSPTQAYVAVQTNDAYLVDVAQDKVLETYSPTRTMFENIFSWVIRPIYYVAPKPGALDNAMQYLLSGSKTQTLNLITNDLEAAQMELDVWTPILTNLGFVVVMLGLSCIYVARKEF